MMPNTTDRMKRNRELISRMRRGEDLKTFSAEQSWFPPRPLISKDKKEIARLYGRAETKSPRTKLNVIKD